MFEKLCTKKNTVRLQLLENELAMLKQGEIDVDDKISKVHLRWHLIGGLRKEYGPFVTSIQGWSQQPSIEELENFLSNKEALAKQMEKVFESDAVLFSKGKPNKKNTLVWNKIKEEDSSVKKGGNSQSCSHHVTENDTLFSEMHQHHGKRVIVIADNSTYPVAKEDVVTIDVADDTRTGSVKFNDVYHVPVKVLDNVKDISADVILIGEKKCSLFVMSAGEAYVKKTSQINNATIWHARLGHAGYQML
ncbi:hypothetical protein Pint_04325 [Pistacia integerrima]|uniref:Uncharacterized protein n=1 Tax=Pistacia integerrima TaxID=434235 RepID=A0ACC0Z9J0_9ROSI|nr:hypothetical protein Pint_04325 [Pistacia integerrima]